MEIEKYDKIAKFIQYKKQTNKNVLIFPQLNPTQNA